jgi:hypothetical protein
MIPTSLRRMLFTKFYRENRLMVGALRDSGLYDYYFDGCKIATRLELLRTEIPNIKVVHLVRHPGAILYHDQRFGTENVEARLAHWLRFHSRCRKFQKILGNDNYLAVPYEKIVQDPTAFLSRAASFLNMTNVQLEDADVIDRSKVHILGNAMREKVQQIIDYSNTWRDHVPDEKQAMATETFRKMDWVVDLYSDWDLS